MKTTCILATIIILVSSNVYANVVPLTIEYTGEIASYFRSDGNVYSLHGTTTNGTASAFDPFYPYYGGMVINNPEEMSSDALRLATLFLGFWQPGRDRYITPPDCWSLGFIQGSLQIEETVQYPMGTPLTLKIDYKTETRKNVRDFFFRQSVVLGDQSYVDLWGANHDTQGNIEAYYIPITVGSTYIFSVFQQIGHSSMPLNQDNIGSALSVDFHVIPEPGTLLLFGFGGLVLRKKIEFNKNSS